MLIKMLRKKENRDPRCKNPENVHPNLTNSLKTLKKDLNFLRGGGKNPYLNKLCIYTQYQIATAH
jgi:hypothetical protein